MKKAYLIVMSLVIVVGITYYNNQRNQDLNKLLTLEEDSSAVSSGSPENFTENANTPAGAATSQTPPSTDGDPAVAFQSPNTAPEIEKLIDSCLGLYFRMNQEIAEMSINELLTVFEDNLGELGDRQMISETNSERSNSEVYAIQVGENESLRVTSEDGIPIELRMEKDGKQFRCLSVDGYASCACSPQMK